MTKQRVDLDALPANDVGGARQVEKIVSQPVKIRAQKKESKLAVEVRNITTHLYADVVLPALKGAITDFITNGMDMMLWGQNAPRRAGGRQNYNRQYDQRDLGRRRPSARVSHRRERPERRQTADVEEIFFASRRDAELTLARLTERIIDYDWATVGDLYSLTGLTSDHTHEMYGWETLDSARVRHDQEGYSLDLPEPIYKA